MGLHLNRQDHGRDRYPPRIVYGVPMRVLARSFRDEHAKTAQGQSGNTRWEYEWHPTIQTGEQPDDPQFEGRLIFATVDQMLASFLNLPYGLPRRLGNINAGALIGSYLILDEFHLYPRDQMMLTVLAMLRMLKGISRFTLMTATFSAPLLNGMADLLEAHVLAADPGQTLEEGLFRDVRNIQTQQRTWHTQAGRLTGERAAELIRGVPRALCICNTVDRAQALYCGLKEALPGYDVRLLHAQFYRDDRKAIEDIVGQRLGKDADPNALERPFVLVATQVVEVGLDISSDVLISECAPAASLIQRAGRCARREDEKGDVHIFQPFDEKGQVNYAPYIDEGQEEVCHLTWTTLNGQGFDGHILRFPEEQALVEAAHGAADKAFVQTLEARIEARIGEIAECINQRDPGWLGSLIRSNTRVSLYIAAAPMSDEKMKTKPWQREAFSLGKGQIARLMDTAQGIDAPFSVSAGIEMKEEDAESAFSRTAYEWQSLKESKEVYGKLWMFAAHPDAVTYSSEKGLILRPGDRPARESPDVKEKPWERPVYHAERYHEHITGLYRAYTWPVQTEQVYHRPLREELLYPLAKLCERLNLERTQGEQLMRLVLALHDVGKLNSRWQAWGRAWQRFRAEHGYEPGLALDDPAPLAHTDIDTDSEAERALQKELKHPPRGNHAVEGAEASLAILQTACGENELWVAAALASIMRHHTPDADECGAFELAAGGDEAIRKALAICGFDSEAQEWAGAVRAQFARSSYALADALDLLMPHANQYLPTLLYLLFVRILRLADQRSGRYLRPYLLEGGENRL